MAVGAEPPRRAVRGRPAPNFAPIPGSPRQPPPSAGPAPLNPLRAAVAAAELSVLRERVPRSPAQPPLPSWHSRALRCRPRRAPEPSPPGTPVSTAAVETSDRAAQNPSRPKHPSAQAGREPRPWEPTAQAARRRRGAANLISRLGCG